MTTRKLTDHRSYILDAEQIRVFAANGHISLSGVATVAEIEQFQPAIKAAVAKYSSETRPLNERGTYGKAFLQITNLWQRDDTVKRFVFEKRFARIAAELLGVEKVRLYHDQALFKEPLGGHTPWHQDQYYWPLDTDRTITMWMPLVDIDTQMGMLAFASGSHKSGPVGSIPISDDSDAASVKYIAEQGFPIVTANRMSAGDATFHLGWTMHSAGRNASVATTREVMTIIYFADGTSITEPQNDEQAADLTAWLGGRRPGDVANSAINPILSQ